MDALLAIKPEFGEKILAGEKHYEFRRTTFRDQADIGLIYLYASSPLKQIIGAFTSERVIEASPEELWELFGDRSGIDQERFMGYFEGVDVGYAIEVDEAQRFEDPLDPDMVFDEFSAPMSFQYLTPEESTHLRKETPVTIGCETVPTTLSRFTTD